MAHKWKLKIVEKKLSKRTLITKFKELAELRKVRPQDSHEGSFVRKAIKEMRDTINNGYSYQVWEVDFFLGKDHKWHETYTEYPTTQMLKDSCDRWKLDLKGLKKLKNGKLRSSYPKIDMPPLIMKKDFMGMPYQIVGHAFTAPLTVINLEEKVDRNIVIAQDKKPFKGVKANYVGTELEFICKLDRSQLTQAFIEANLHRYVRIKSDGSLHSNPDLGGHTHEVNILCKEEDMTKIIPRVCSVMKAAGGYVNDTCGMHMHFDARNRDHLIMYHNMVRLLPLLKSIVPSNRSGNNYCKSNTSVNPIENNDRYQAINPQSYGKYRTVEVRLHSGTLNPDKILNWFAIIKHVVDRTDKLSAVIDINNFTTIFNPDVRLVKYVAARQEKFKVASVSTFDDHNDTTQYEIAV